MLDDYQPGDEFDWDQSDDSQRCTHGTFIGSWWGPDLMCQWCEDGVSLPEYQRIMRDRAARHQRVVEGNEALDEMVHAYLTFRQRPGFDILPPLRDFQDDRDHYVRTGVVR